MSSHKATAHAYSRKLFFFLINNNISGFKTQTILLLVATILSHLHEFLVREKFAFYKPKEDNLRR